MTKQKNEAPPIRGTGHIALSVFLGDWRAKGTSFGGTDQSQSEPRANGVPWVSTHSARWHTGEFFLIQDERARLDGKPFDTLSVLGVDDDTGVYFARSFENHGYYRRYGVSVHGRTWLIEGKTERARTVFSIDGNTQTIAWEWLRNDQWLPLCDRIATRVDAR
jgi:hypothetical protein